MRPWKDRGQPIIELKTVTIPRAQFPTRQQINSPIEIKISLSTLRIEPVRVCTRCFASLLSFFPAGQKNEAAAARLEKPRSMLAAYGTGSLSIRLAHVCT